MVNFTTTWFRDSGLNNFEKFLLPRFKNKDNLDFLEIGCWEGMATRWMLENVLTGKYCWLNTIDTFEGSYDHQDGQVELKGLKERYLENVEEFGNKVITNQGYSQDILKENYLAWDGHFDFIYVDGSHRSPDAIQDLVLSWPMLKKGGLMIMDDYAFGNLRTPNDGCLAMESFLACYDGQYNLLLKDYQIVIEKL